MRFAKRYVRDPEALKKQIVQIAFDIIKDSGYDNLSIRKIAEQIGYSTTVVYSLFPDKLSMVSEVIRSNFDKFDTRLKESGFYEVSDPLVRIKTGLTAFVERGIEIPNFYMAVFRNYMEQINRNREEFFLVNRGYEALSYLHSSIEEAMRKGMVAKADSMECTAMIWSASMGLILSLIQPNDKVIGDPKSFISRYLDVMIEGLKKGA